MINLKNWSVFRKTFIFIVICIAIFQSSIVLAACYLRGNVYRYGLHDNKIPFKGKTIYVEETGDSFKTIRKGFFKLFLPQKFRTDETITLRVKTSKYRVLHPYDGKIKIPLNLQKSRVIVLVDKTGSHQFLSREHFRLLIEKTARKSKEQVKSEKARRKVDLTRYLKDWAVKYGFSVEIVRAELDKWAAEVEVNNNDLYELGLAAFYKNNFSEAAEKFNDYGDHKTIKFEAIRKKKAELIVQEKKILEDIVHAYTMSGDSYYNDYRFNDALKAYQKALARIGKKITPEKWASLMNNISNSYSQLAVRIGGEKLKQYHKKAVFGYNDVLKIYTRKNFPEGWAMVNNNLGVALKNQGIRTGGKEGILLLGEAVTAFRLALQIYTRKSLPQDWAMAQNNLGNALSGQGIRIGGKEGALLLGEAVTAYRLALEIYTRKSLPQYWAMVNNNLGVALKNQGISIGGNEGALLLDEAVAAYRLVLETRTRKILPQDWAMTQNNLGTVLLEQGIRTGGKEGVLLLDKAIAVFRLALETCPRKDFPGYWSIVQKNLENTLKTQKIMANSKRD
ncbi:MAG: hypothetical protein GY754_46690 [bacterium]|nr:hypothetical protein [bacterium]